MENELITLHDSVHYTGSAFEESHRMVDSFLHPANTGISNAFVVEAPHDEQLYSNTIRLMRVLNPLV
jgi:hypothetical protein